jgi:DNA-binding NtrC family response regulator
MAREVNSVLGQKENFVSIIMLSKALKAEGIEVITTTKIEEAKCAIRNTFFDVVLADIHLTGVIGRMDLEFLRHLHEKSPGTRVIIMSSYGSEEIEKKTCEKGVYCYFDKPFDLRVLNEKLREIGIFNNFLTKISTASSLVSH